MREQGYKHAASVSHMRSKGACTAALTHPRDLRNDYLHAFFEQL
ncbi:MAG: hypothetical protein ACI8QC_003155 [Planctomycetota bacterium]|jgi:hypothetical protein